MVMVSPARKLLSALDDRRAADLCRELLAKADILVGGDRPWDIQVHDERLWVRLLRDGHLGLGEAYVDGYWDCEQLDVMLTKMVHARLYREVQSNWPLLAYAVKTRLFNLQALRPYEIAEKHYDIGNDLYEPMLDRRMQYTCGYWRHADPRETEGVRAREARAVRGNPPSSEVSIDLDAAQEAKLDLVCRKLGLEPGMRVLELGCGWGGFAMFAAERYGAHVTGYNVSKEQIAWARERIGSLPIELHLDDYRNATGTYDAVVSIGLFEHVGPKNYRSYMELVDRCLVPEGTSLVHTIGSNRTRAHMDPWFDRYIFPNAVFPTLGGLCDAMEDLLVPEDVQNIGEHYDRTLMAWWENFDRAWPSLRARYGDRFYRVWRYYLLCSAATFRSRFLQLYQVVFTRQGAPQPSHVRSS